jgi:ABC-type multidrug transport system ATPase subunit
VTSSDFALVLDGLSLRYSRRAPWALDRFSCRFPRGEICGLVGPNGAGKTSLFSVISGFLPQDHGRVDILGEGEFRPERFKGRLSVLPQDAVLDGRLTSLEFLQYMGTLQGMSGSQAATAARQTLASVNLDNRATDRIGSLSHGMGRRLAVASALLGQPELVLLDEPLSGLDPAQARSLRAVLMQLRGSTTLVVSSHNLSELERICDYIVLVDAGRCVLEGAVDEVCARSQLEHWELGAGEVPLEALAARLPEHSFHVEGSVLVHGAPPKADLDMTSVVVAELLAAAGVPIRALSRGRSLEQSFFEDRASRVQSTRED